LRSRPQDFSLPHKGDQNYRPNYAASGVVDVKVELGLHVRFWQCARNITIRYLVIPWTIGIQARPILFPSGTQVFKILYEYPKSFKT